MAVKVTFPDGAVREYESGITVEEVAASISSGLKKNAVIGKVNGKPVDLNTAIEEDAALEIVTLDSEAGIEVYRHSTAHLMAQAIKRIYGDKAVKLGIGPVIEDGFYYDIDMETSLTPDDLTKIEKEMERIVQENLPIRRRVVSRQEAIAIFSELEDPLKLELIRDLPEDSVITIYDQGEFFLTCAAVRICLRPAVSKRSSCLAWPALTGAATPRTKCCSASTERLSLRRLSLTSICISWKKRRSAITGNWARS